jgi:hypothetical protein
LGKRMIDCLTELRQALECVHPQQSVRSSSFLQGSSSLLT